MKRLCLLCILFCMACSPAMAVKTLKLHHAGQDDPLSSATGAMARVFKNLVEIGTNGELRVTILANSVIGPDPDALKQVKAGHIQSAILRMESLLPSCPLLAVLEAPFALPNALAAAEVLDGPMGQTLIQTTQQATGLKVLGFADADGFIQLVVLRRDRAEDLQGLRTGVMSPLVARLVTRLGGHPVLLTTAELLPALQDGRLDAAAATLAELNAARVGETRKTLVLANALLPPVVWTMNESFWKNLTPDEQRLVAASARTALTAGRGVARALEASERGLPALRNDMKVVVLTPEIRARLREEAMPSLRGQLVLLGAQLTPEAKEAKDIKQTKNTKDAQKTTEIKDAQPVPDLPEAQDTPEAQALSLLDAYLDAAGVFDSPEISTTPTIPAASATPATHETSATPATQPTPDTNSPRSTNATIPATPAVLVAPEPQPNTTPAAP